MGSIRRAAVAGYFYPGSRGELRQAVESLLGAAAPPAPGTGPKALIAPHAGYQYSGPIAARAFNELAAEAGAIRRIVLLGPAHRVAVRGLALPETAAFETPLGIVPVDRDLEERIAHLPQVVHMAEAHAGEHSLEVELPFLQVLLGEFTCLPLVVGRASPGEVAEVLDLLWDGAETRIVISSDLSHYLTYEEATAVDRETADRILRLQGPIAPDRACGGVPVSGLLESAGRHRLVPELLDLRNSGDTAGDRSRVVGYGAFAFREGAGS